MTRMVSQILWEHCMGELGIDGNNYENDTFAVRSYDWVDEDNNEWHFWHKPSGLKVEWYKYPLRGFEVNMDITDDQFLDVLRDCTNSMEDGKAVRFLHDIRRWWVDRKTEPTISKMEQVDWKDQMWAEAVEDEPQTESLEQFRVGLEYHTDTTHFGREKGKSITTDTTNTQQTDCDRYVITNDEGDKEYNCIGCTQTDCAWK